MEKLKECLGYLIVGSHSPKKEKGTSENVGKMTRTEARVKKQKTVINKNTIIISCYSFNIAYFTLSVKYIV